jgi:hypothetical protein
MKNRRQHLRTASDLLVELSHPAIGSLTVKARDLSEGGVSIDMGHHSVPPVGTELSVVIKRHTGAINAAPVKMRVMHVQSNGSVGLKFI